MKIAVVGLRGVPATFGGIEKHCEEIYQRIIKMGHEVTIYTRRGYTGNDREFNGIKIVPLRTFESKHLENAVHTFWALTHAVFSDADIIHFHAQGPCLFAWLPKVLAPRKKLVFTCHGIDWQRNKWNKPAKIMIYTGEIFSAGLFDTQITVSKTLEDYYKAKYNINSITITNGVNLFHPMPAKFIKEKYGLNKGDYLTFVGRLVPEKAPHKLIEAFKGLKTDKKLVIVGGSAATDEYENHLKNLAKGDERIIFTSYLYGEKLREIYSNAFLYLSASELEGLPLTILEAMSYGIPVLASPIPPHVEIIGRHEEYGYLFNSHKTDKIREKLEFILNMPEAELIKKGIKGQEKIRQDHSWNNVARKLEIVYKFTKSHTISGKLKATLKRVCFG